MRKYTQNLHLYAARYAHNRNTGAASQVVSEIIANWDLLDADIKAQLKKEAANEATCNSEDWDKLKGLD